MTNRSPAEEVKERLDIVDVIGSYVKLQKSGANYRSVCPFHSENSPSFFVSPSKQIWHCFGACSEGGDVLSFVMKIEGVSFREALRMLAHRAGVKMESQDPEKEDERKRIADIAELACKFYEKHRDETDAGRRAAAYLQERGFTQESITEWRLGYAPDAWRKLSQFLLSRGYTVEELARAGVVVVKERESADGKNIYYDRFRSRIIFPICDLGGRVVGFGGRRFEGDTAETTSSESPKYLNTPNTPLYDKSRVLYGLDKAKVEIRRRDVCILVEGYADAIMASLGGSPNVVATSGTALTETQLRILKRYTDNLLLAFDMDLAGDSATRRGIEMAQREGFAISVADLPEEKDPADLVAESVERWQEAIANTKDIIAFHFDAVFARFEDASAAPPRDKAQAADELLPVIARIPNSVERSQWLQELAHRLDVEETALQEELRQYRVDRRGEAKRQSHRETSLGAKERNTKKSRRELLEEWVLTLLCTAPSHLPEMNEETVQLFSGQRAAIASFLWKRKSDIASRGLTEDDMNELGEQQREHVNYLIMKGEVSDVSETETELRKALQSLHHIAVQEQLNELSKKIREAERQEQSGKAAELLQEFSRLSQKLNH